MNKKNTKDKTPLMGSREKLGLALSGGGFRASFFHIGVLAQMAMLGLLRHVEVISTVSGGSIIGALYYLHVKKLLEEKGDETITDQDFVEIIQKIERDFFHAVRRNIRMRTFSNPLKNLRMSRANYSRSDRIGELYDRYFYRKVIDPDRKTPIEMRELKIRPDGKDFYPRTDNVRRKAKVPILLINATTLNTGHNWRFEASHMGEPPRIDDVAKDIDKNLRLRRPPSYEAIITKQQDVELGLAVAASACVPGIFHPLAISDLYPDNIRVQLVDGGLHDNQGIQGLIDEECTRFVVSDASGQMEDKHDPATGMLPVLTRMNTTLMDRVREEQMSRLFQQFNPKGSNVSFMHLLKGLPAKAVSWIGQDGKPAEEIKTERQPKTTSRIFGVAESVQDLLSHIRTDLDSFTEIEAYSLMLDGYNMSQEELCKASSIEKLISPVDNSKWNFLSIAPWVLDPTTRYEKHLRVGGQRLFKPFRLSPILTIVTSCFAATILILFFILIKNELREFLSFSFKVSHLLIAVLVLLMGFIPKLSRMFKVLRFLRYPSEFLVRFIIRGLIPAIGSLFVNIHLWIFNPIFLQKGKVKRLGSPAS